MLYATTNISYSIFIGNDSNLVITSNTWSKWVKGIEYEEMWVYRVDDDLLQGKFILNSVYRMKLMMNIDRKENWSKMQFLIEARRSFHLCHCSAHVDCARATTISRKEKRTQYSLSRSHTKIMHKTTFDTYTRALSSDFFLSLSLSYLIENIWMDIYSIIPLSPPLLWTRLFCNWIVTLVCVSFFLSLIDHRYQQFLFLEVNSYLKMISYECFRGQFDRIRIQSAK